MAEIETTPGLTEKPPVVDLHYKTDSVHSSNDEEPSLSHGHDHEHRDNKPPPETEELSDIYDPNVYAGASRLSLAP
jgi:hypothetical protein